MTARVTEAELLAQGRCEACEKGYRLTPDGLHYDDACGGGLWGVCRFRDGHTRRTLVAEIRRLRAIILGARTLISDRHGYCRGCSAEWGSRVQHDEGCPVAALQAEAEAILAERKEKT